MIMSIMLVYKCGGRVVHIIGRQTKDIARSYQQCAVTSMEEQNIK